MQRYFKTSSKLLIFFTVFVLPYFILLLTAIPSPAKDSPEKETKDESKQYFYKVAKRYPALKTIIRLELDQPIDHDLLLNLQKYGLKPVNRDWISLMNRSEAIFSLRGRSLLRLKNTKLADAVTPLEKFLLHGFYRIHFKIMEKEPEGPLLLTVSSPRDNFGKQLLQIEQRIYPSLPYKVKTDTAGNRRLKVKCPNPKYKQVIRCDFHFTYKVDVKKMLERALYMADDDKKIFSDFLTAKQKVGELAEYTKNSKKIDAESSQVQTLAKELAGSVRSPIKAYKRVHEFTEQKIRYDHEKRSSFFGGDKIYSNMKQMYQPVEKTLQQKVGACPDTSILKAAILRSAGFPARTAGRWGHFYTEIYLPGQGWLSPSVTPTGIPLIKDQNHVHTPFVNWSPHMKIQTSTWWGQVEIKKNKEALLN